MSVQNYPLANGVDGNPLEVPAHAVAWRVRRGGGRRGRPRVVFDAETGKQLEVPLTASVDELVAHGCPPGRYRLEAIDANGQPIPGIVGITEVFHTEAEDDDGDEQALRNLSLVERQMQLIEQQNLVLFRVIDAMTGAFGTVQPTFPPAFAAAPEAAGAGLASLLPLLKPEGLSGIAKLLGALGKLGNAAGGDAEGGEA